MRAGTRRVVEWPGEYGGIVDSSLRALAATPLGPWPLVLVAVGLIMFAAGPGVRGVRGWPGAAR